MTTVVVSAARRTPIGSFMGQYLPLRAPELGAVAIKSAISKAQSDLDQIDEVYMGCVLSAGLGQAPARQASLAAGIPERTPCTTVNKMCGSGMQTVMSGADRITSGHAEIIVAGGMESMSNAPHILPKMRSGNKLGHAHTVDHMLLDGLEDAYEKGRLMGEFAEDCASHYGFSREDQDEFAVTSLSRAQKNIAGQGYQDEVEPVIVG